MVTMGEFIERIDFAAVFLWMAGAFARITLYLWAGAVAAAQVFGLTDHRPLVLVFAAAAGVIARYALFKLSILLAFVATTYVAASIVLGIALPLFVWAVALARGRPRRQGASA